MRAVLIFSLLLWTAVSDVSASDVSGRAQVIDGDTLRIGDVRIRLFGIDAPEQDQTCISPDGDDWPCGLWVTEQVTGMVEGKSVSCVARGKDR